MVTLPQKKEAAEVMMLSGLSERSACALLNLHRTTRRYQSRRSDDAELREEIRTIAHERRRFGYRRIHTKLRKKGRMVNHKKVYRIYSEEELKLLQKKSKKLSKFRGSPMAVLAKPNARWSLDFVHDILFNGRRLRTLNVVDDHTRECLGIEVDFSLSGARVTRSLDRMIWWYVVWKTCCNRIRQRTGAAL